MVLSIEHTEAREAFLASVEAFVSASQSAEELRLLGHSRCEGWSRLDVIVHVMSGWQELLGGMVSRSSQAPSVDAASYWTAFADDHAHVEPVLALMAERRRTCCYSRPAAAVAQLSDVAGAVCRGAAALAARTYAFQSHTLTSGDLLATWAVENAVHHLDLDLETESLRQLGPPRSALRLARLTCEAIIERRLPDRLDDARAVLVATGREKPPIEYPDLGVLLPALG